MLGAGFPAGVAGGWGGGEQQMWTQARQVMSGESLGDHPPQLSCWPVAAQPPQGGCGGCRSGELGRARLGLRAVSRTPHRAVSKNNTTFIGSWGLGCPVR